MVCRPEGKDDTMLILQLGNLAKSKKGLGLENLA